MKVSVPTTVEVSHKKWKYGCAMIGTAGSLTLGYVLVKVWNMNKRQHPNSPFLRGSDQIIWRSKNPEPSKIMISRGTLTDSIVQRERGIAPPESTNKPAPHLDMHIIRDQLDEIAEMLNEGPTMFRARAVSAPCLPFAQLNRLNHLPLNQDSDTHYGQEDEPPSVELALHQRYVDETDSSDDGLEEESKENTDDSIDRRLLSQQRNHSTTVLSWDAVFEQHQNQIEDVSEALPIVIGQDIESGALKVINEHIARRLTRLFRKYCKSEILLLHFNDFMVLVRDYLEAAKTWVPRYIQTVTMVKLRMSVAALQHNADFNKQEVAERVSGVLAPYLMECFKVIRLQIDAMSDDDEVEFICKFCFDQMKRKEMAARGIRIPPKYIDCESFISVFPTLMEKLFEFQKLVPAFREGLQKADISVSLNSGITKQISVPQLGDDLFEDGDFADRWVRALDEMEMEQLIDSKK